MGKERRRGGKASTGADAGTPPTAEEAVQHAAKHRLLGGRKGKAVTYGDPLWQFPVEARGNADCPVEVVTVGAFEAVVQMSAGAAPAVLDFASDSNPGGSWRSKQQGTQEEALCRASTLGLKLESHFAETGGGGYMPGKESCVYVPEVAIFWAKGSGWLVPAIPCAVVAAALRDVNGDAGALRRKVRSVLVTAAAHGHRRLVLGAWGCGAFGNDPALVTAAFRDEVRAAAARGDVEHVVFAMGDSGAGRRNAALFREVFGLPPAR